MSVKAEISHSTTIIYENVDVDSVSTLRTANVRHSSDALGKNVLINGPLVLSTRDDVLFLQYILEQARAHLEV
jgi:hypothetical protein